jgi:RNA polymerase sigma-54 factor
MALGPRLDLRQSQSLVMTPRLQQAIKLLALSNVEIETFIAEALERNPLLEIDRSSGDAPSPPEESSAPDAPAAVETTGSDEMMSAGTSEQDAPLDMQSGDVFIDDCVIDQPMSLSAATLSPLSGGDDTSLEDWLTSEIDLHDHLGNQAAMVLSGHRLLIARELIGMIDECGYLVGDLLDLSVRLGLPLEEIKQVLGVVQTFEPSGIGARTLAECLAIQARDANRYDPCIEALLDNLDLLARGEFARLQRICRVDEEDLADMIAEVRSYDPRPGLRFASAGSTAVIPDLFVNPTSDAGWSIEINAASLPKLIIDRRYHVQLRGECRDRSSKSWLSECMADASWLIKALDQRQRTIINVASEIVRCQDGFFRYGVSRLRPLTLRQVADTLSLHESTVSRVTSNKYLTCPRGTFELKYFFTSGIASSEGGDAVSAEAVKAAIKSLIDQEEPSAILSDDTLVTMLNDQGFDIARRTVAKYRESLGLGSSVQRRRQKKLLGQR